MIDNLIHPTSWVHWLILYLCVGGLGLVILGLRALQIPPSSFAKTISAALGHKKTVIEVAQDWFVYLIAASCVVIGWPGFLIWLVFEKEREAKNEAWYNLPDFSAAPEFLIKKAEISEAESQSIVYDPIGETPNTPFGHLNKAWEIFKNKKPEGSELQLFLIPKGSKTGKYKTEADSEIKGYAWVLRGIIAEEFVYEES